jgi:crossover junction endodeoxyribonuclease RusA
VAGPIMLTITYFYDSISMDVDNLPKPISDALRGLVYLDDEQVTDVLCRKRNLNRDFRVENPSSVLADGLSRGNEFLYIVVAEAPDQEVFF